MASWRESADPRCPECDGPLASTASYCMHCDADLPYDDAADASDADDVTYTGSSPLDRDARIGSWLFDRLTSNSSTDRTTADDEYPTPSVGPDRPSDRRSEPTKSSLWLRLPVAVLVSIPVAVVAFLVVLGLAGHLSGSTGLGLLLGGWVLSSAHLARKPFPSDIAGDAAYALAALILLAPAIGYLLLIGRSIVSSEAGADTIPTLIGELLIVEFVALFPAGLFAVIGLVGNELAARKLGSDADGES